jgi:hypothetical protein
MGVVWLKPGTVVLPLFDRSDLWHCTLVESGSKVMVHSSWFESFEEVKIETEVDDL